MTRRQRWRLAAALGVAVGLLVPLIAECHVRAAASGRLAIHVADVDPTLVGTTALVLGTARTLADGRLNTFYTARLAAVEELYRSGTVTSILVSGDNSRQGYDEPTAMRDDLIAAGIPGAIIWRDFAGLRTLDSVIRARAVFGLKRCIIVSQPGHLRRAVYLARAHGLDAQGFVARDVAGAAGARQWLRERLAVMAAAVDVTVARGPRHLGPSVLIGHDPAN